MVLVFQRLEYSPSASSSSAWDPLSAIRPFWNHIYTYNIVLCRLKSMLKPKNKEDQYIWLLKMQFYIIFTLNWRKSHPVVLIWYIYLNNEYFVHALDSGQSVRDGDGCPPNLSCVQRLLDNLWTKIKCITIVHHRFHQILDRTQ